MAISVVMPALEMAQETGKLLAWRKKEGERVTKGEPLLEIETDKAVVEIEAPADGILAGVRSEVGAVVPVGETIAWIVAPGEKPPVASGATIPTGRTKTEAAKPAAAAAPATESTASANMSISPKARRLAKELAVDIAQIRGTGPDGAITSEDVQAAKASPQVAAQPSAGAAPSGKLSAIARLMAERTAKSWTTVPHFFVVRDADARKLLELQKKLKAKHKGPQSAAPSFTDCLVSLIAQVLERHPAMNSSWVDETIRQNPAINMSLAIAVPDGVVAPVIHNANKATLAEIAEQRAALAERARAGRLVPADLSAGTFTISNLGMFKVDSFTAIITPPQAAILAVGAVADRVVAIGGKPAVRPMMTLSLSNDHRVVDGARSAAFLNDVVEAIRAPQELLFR
jgi:pyruvate dehydrogenase E2 component (dihydrolipoamide acetyltransferase)